VRVGGYEVDTPRAVLAVFAVVTVSALVVGGATSAAAFGAFNPSWEGTTDVRDIAGETGAETVVVDNTTEYEAYGNETVAVVLSPNESYTEAEIERTEAFLDRGGTLLVADRDGTANELLAALGADARIDGALLRDDRAYYRDPALPRATNVEDHPLTEDVDALTLNYGTAVEPGDATVLVSSSDFGYLDRNENEAIDDDETLDSYPVATTENVSEGRVVVVGDASAFINVMAERPGNRQFARNLFSSGDTVLVDTSHSGGVPPLIAALLTVRGSLPLQFGLVGAGLLVVFGWQRRAFDRGDDEELRRRPSPETLADSATDRYPGFDRARVRRLMKGIKSITSQRGDDE
jgi:hypothetical protein